jgi:hypothetical protein
MTKSIEAAKVKSQELKGGAVKVRETVEKRRVFKALLINQLEKDFQ